MAFASVHVVPLARARRVERLFRWLDALLAAIPDTALVLRGQRAPSKRIAVKLKDWVTRRRVFADPALAPDYFLIEVFNPGPETLRLSLTLQNPPAPDRRPPLQKLFEITPGFHRYKIDYAEIAGSISFPMSSSRSMRAARSTSAHWASCRTRAGAAPARWRSKLSRNRRRRT
jgi:hypothetical protein